MKGVRPHLEAAQLALMEAAAQARINEDRAIYQSADGRITPVIKAASVNAQVNHLLQQLNLILDHPTNGN